LGDFEEWLHPSDNDYRRFVTAVTGGEVTKVMDFPLTLQFFPFALPSWGIVGSSDLPKDGASLAAVPGLAPRTGRIMGLGQQTELHKPVALGASLRRISRLVSDEEKLGASGTFRLLTVGRKVYLEEEVLATQSEFFALGGAR
jgi:hypothetical protein